MENKYALQYVQKIVFLMVNIVSVTLISTNKKIQAYARDALISISSICLLNHANKSVHNIKHIIIVARNANAKLA